MYVCVRVCEHELVALDVGIYRATAAAAAATLVAGSVAFVSSTTSRFVKETVHEFCGLNAIRWAKHMTSEQPQTLPSFVHFMPVSRSVRAFRRAGIAECCCCVEFLFKRWKRSPRRIHLGGCKMCEEHEGSMCIPYNVVVDANTHVCFLQNRRWRTKCNLCLNVT